MTTRHTRGRPARVRVAGTLLTAVTAVAMAAFSIGADVSAAARTEQAAAAPQRDQAGSLAPCNAGRMARPSGAQVAMNAKQGSDSR